MYRIYTTPSDSRNPLFPSSLSSSLDPSLPKRPGRRRGRSLRWPALGAAAATLLLLHAPPSSRHKGGATAPPPPGAAPVQRVAEAPRAVPRAGRPQRRRGASWPRRWPPALRRGAASSRRCVCSCHRRNPRRLCGRVSNFFLACFTRSQILMVHFIISFSFLCDGRRWSCINFMGSVLFSAVSRPCRIHK